MSDTKSALQINNLPPSPTSMKYFLLVFIISIFFFGRILWPFWSILVLSFLLTNLFRPIYIFANKKLPESLASAFTCLLIIAIVFIPLVFFVFALADEALNLVSWGKRQPGRLETPDISPGKPLHPADSAAVAGNNGCYIQSNPDDRCLFLSR